MANPMRAEAQVSIDAGTFTLVYSLNALSAIKAARPDVPLNDLLTGLAEKGAEASEDICLIIWAGMQKHHRDYSLEAVGDLVELGDMKAWAGAISSAMGGGAQVADEPSGAPAAANPRKAAAKR